MLSPTKKKEKRRERESERERNVACCQDECGRKVHQTCSNFLILIYTNQLENVKAGIVDQDM